MAELWYYTSEGKRMEPVTAGELRHLAEAGFLQPTDLVWKEGMANWAAASSIKGLFATTPPPAPPPRAEPETTFEPAPRTRPPIEELPRRRRAIEDDDDEDDDRPRRRRRRASRGNGGLVIGLIIGGGVLVLLLVGVIVFIATRSGSFATYTVDLPALGTHTREFTFKANVRYEFVVTSTQFTDVDLYLVNANDQPLTFNNQVAADTSIGPNSRIVWFFPNAGAYRVKVINLDGGRGNRSTVTIRELGPGQEVDVPPMLFGNGPFNIAPGAKRPAGMPPVVKAQAPAGPPIVQANGTTQRVLPVLQAGQETEIVVTYPVAKQVEVNVQTIQRNIDVDLYVDEFGGARITEDVVISPDCHVVFGAQAGKTYRFRVVNLGPGTAQSTITYTTP
jgi:hypothetical protein